MSAPAAPSGFARGPADGLCLDFANTKYWRGLPEPTEELRAPDDLLAWCERQGGVDKPAVMAARTRWEAGAAQAETALAASVALREAIYRVFAAIAMRERPKLADLVEINTALAASPTRRGLRREQDSYVWQIAAPETGEEPLPWSLLAPVLWSAGDLLTGSRLPKVRRCANPQCLWLFLDDSKSGNRRWCSMATCGNRAKAHRHYLRQKENR